MGKKGRECAGWRARGGRTRGLRARRHGSLGLGTGEATRRREGGKMRGQTGGCGVSPARRRCRSIQGAVRAVHDLVPSTRTGTRGSQGLLVPWATYYVPGWDRVPRFWQRCGASRQGPDGTPSVPPAPSSSPWHRAAPGTRYLSGRCSNLAEVVGSERRWR